METRLCVQVELPNGSLLKLGGLKLCTSVSVLKNRVEQQAGILPHTYRLTYLDAAPLKDSGTLRELDVVSGATLRAVAWRLWHEVVTATLRGDVKTCLGELRAIGDKGDAEWRAHCGWCTLYTAAHCGHYVLLCDLLKEWPTASVNAQSPCGWTVLHVAARMGRWKVLCVLIDNGADVKITDKRGRTAADIAHSSGHKKCEQSLRFCEWNIKKYGIMCQRMQEYDAGKERNAATRTAHQYTDSRHPIWLSGPRGPEYIVHTPNPVSVKEVEKFRAKQTQLSGSTCKQVAMQQPQNRLAEATQVKLPSLITTTPKPVGDMETGLEERRLHLDSDRIRFDYSWFDKLRAQQLVPTTYHILTYSNPSSSHLQPRSLINPGGYVHKSTPHTPPS